MNKRTIVLDKALKEYCDKNYGDFSPPGNPRARPTSTSTKMLRKSSSVSSRICWDTGTSRNWA